MKFVFFVEGFTEKKTIASFLKRWLDAQLDKPVGIQTVRFDGWAELIKDAKTKAHLHLGKSDVIAVVSLLDLYGPTIYPSECVTAEDRQRWGTKSIQDNVGHTKFHHFFAIHETEAWLLSQPTLFPREVHTLFPSKVATPEKINFN